MGQNNVNPLNWQVPIVNKDGTPTDEFMRKWQQQATTNSNIPSLSTATQVSAVLDKIGATVGAMLVRGATLWGLIVPDTANKILVDGGGGAGPSWQTISGMLDTVFGNTRGGVLFRGATTWQFLAHGSNGDVLTSGGPSADPSWQAAGGGGGVPVGTPPAIVQSAVSVAASPSVTLGAAPTNGNLLVAFVSTPTTGTPGSGWTLQVSNTSGTDFGFFCTKVAGAGESATQTPCSGSPTSIGIMIWELSGAAASPIIGGSITSQVTSISNSPSPFPGLTNVLALGAGAAIASATISGILNMTQDQLNNTGTARRVAGGHSNASTPLAMPFLKLAASGSSKVGVLLVTS